MGEVYRAIDTNLKRAIAIKVLPTSVAADAGRLARFQREAEVLASLNHPHIAAIYGLEDADGVKALVLELVEGPTLADRIAQGPIPLDEAIPIARQIAEAVEAAHEQGIIHRDLKPANIKLRSDGTVKVLDFGLAKALDPLPTSIDASQSAAITSPAMTGMGVIMGTAAYMSAEQARGKAVDKRSDIWAFGCVLYEMLTGRRAFEGEDISDTLANVLKIDPDWQAIPPEVPAAIRVLLRRCLDKDRRTRVADISTALFVFDEAAGLRGALEGPAEIGPYVRGEVSRWRRVVPAAGALIVGGAIVGGAVWWSMRTASPAVVRTTIATTESTALVTAGGERDVAVTPDGSRIVYRGTNQMLVRVLNQIEPDVLGGLGAARNPFISPDGQWIGFADGLTLKKVAITGGPPGTIAPADGQLRGATWGPDGTIVFATFALATGLQRVSSAGGEPMVLTKPDRERGENDHLWPEFLPGGGAVLFTIYPSTGGPDNAQVAVLDLKTGASKVLVRGGSHAHYVPTGHLVYGVAGTLRAVPFDLERLEATGTPAPVLEGVWTTPLGAANFAVAANGSLVYVAGLARPAFRNTIASVDRQGRGSPLPGVPPDLYRDVRVSPDGARLALATRTDVSTYDFARGTLSRLTTDPAEDRSPLWTPDGQRIIFTSRRAGYWELFWRPADGTGTDERLLSRAKDLIELRADGWSPGGSHVLVTEVSPASPISQCAIGQIPIGRSSDVRVLVKSDFCNQFSALSPNRLWMAYQSNVGREEIYVERYPEQGSRQQISTDGGVQPLWSRNGRELFFGSLDGRQMFVVPVQSGTTLVAGRPQVLFETAMIVPPVGSRTYDLAPDGRFIVIRPAEEKTGRGAAPSLILVQNWFEELKRLVPTR
jgi:Protein kinase domain/WD40-like Beta Propeller Repeat